MSHNDLKKKYPHTTEGKAVFFSPRDRKSFYFESGALKWNFSYRDRNPDGISTLDGIFYYHKAFFDQEPEHPIEADFRVQATRQGSLYAHITFYAQGPQPEKDLLGEFLAKDPNNVVAGFEGRGDRLTGKWNVVHGDSLEDRLRKKYEGRETKTDALFYKSGAGGMPSLHLVVDLLRWEFLYGGNPPVVPGLTGILFYNGGFFDQEVSEPINADFLVEQKVEKSKRYVLIKFYKPDTRNAELLGEFLAEHLDNESKDLLDQRKIGQWKLLPGSDLQGELGKKYKNKQVSDALLYKSSEVPPLQSFRLEVYNQGWEFWDNTFAIGHRLPGLLFYNVPIIENDAGPIKTTYYIERKRGIDGYYALVGFYAPGSNPVAWGEFLALDTANRAGGADLLNKDLNGEWKQTTFTIRTATALKQNKSTKITLSVLESIAGMECEKEDKIYGDAFNVKGALFSNDSKTHTNCGDFVRWYKDRAIFYENSTAADFTSFFFPTELEDTIGSQDDLKMNVTWK